MNRREFVTGLSVAAAWPLSAWAQQSAMPVIGWLSSASAKDWVDLVEVFHHGLKEAGYVQGHNVAMEFRWAEGVYDLLPEMAADLVRKKVSVIFTSSGHLSPQAAKNATASIPIVFLSGNDPVEFGLVTSLSRPAGNITGLFMISSALGPQQLSLLRELVPQAARVVLIANPADPNAKVLSEQLHAAAPVLGIEFETLMAGTEAGLDGAFSTLVERRAEGVIIANDPYLRSRTEQFNSLAGRYGVPVIYPYREFVTGGGLISYGTSLKREFHRAALYTGRILSGAKPSDLPILQPTDSSL